MSGYRPKSLEELNNMYDKTLAAEKAIKRGTSLVEKTSENALLNNLTEDIERIAEEVKQSMGISEEINDFIAKYSYDKPEEEKAEAKPKPQMTVLVPEQPRTEKVSYELFENKTEAEAPPAEAAQEMPKPDRADLMDEYMRIMNDEEDDEVPHKKLSRKEKKKLKMMEKREAEKAAQQNEAKDEAAPVTEAEAVSDFTYDEEPESFYNIADDASESSNAVQQRYTFESAEEEFKAPEYVAVGAEPVEAAYSLDKEESDNDFAFPEDYTPAWMKEGKDEEAVKPKKAKKKTQPSNNILAKGLLSIVLAVLVFIGTTATVFKTLIPVNTGKAANDTFYFFTAYKDYADLDIKKGDLIITEKRYAQDGDIFAYIDYSNKSFEFGRRSDSITDDNGVVLLVTENQGNRTLVSRDDCKGVMYAVYPTVGTFISILSDNFIIIIAAVAVSALIIILILALAFRSKKTKAKSSGNVKKAEKVHPEEPEIEEIEEVDLFTTIG